MGCYGMARSEERRGGGWGGRLPVSMCPRITHTFAHPVRHLILHARVSRAVKNSVIFKGDRTKSGLDLIAFEYDFSLTSIKGLHITRLARCQRLREKLQEEFLVLEYIKCRPKHLRLRRVGTNLFVLLVLSVRCNMCPLHATPVPVRHPQHGFHQPWRVLYSVLTFACCSGVLCGVCSTTTAPFLLSVFRY